MKIILKNFLFFFKYIIFLLIVVIIVDIFLFHNVLGYGYPRHYQEENIYRYSAPYVEFTGKPNVSDHNKYGFRGEALDKAKKDDIKIAFFGGSTGYFGEPSIPVMVGEKLTELLGRKVFIANYSVVSSNHRQHLHGIIEYISIFNPDIVIFYGGYNELIQPIKYDPRPGYPYNFFYKAETSNFYQLLLQYSALAGELDKRSGIFTGLNELKKSQHVYTEDWNKRIVNKYIETLELAHDVTLILKSNYFGKTKFIAFYQPYQINNRVITIHNAVKQRIKEVSYICDVLAVYDKLGVRIYKDIVHVNQQAKEVMATSIVSIIYNNYFDNDNNE